MGTNEKKMDRRVRKTKTAIHTALLELMKDKDIDDITVIELTEKADINRKTFYNHYSDINSVLEELEDESVNHLVGIMNACSLEEYLADPSRFFENMITEFRDNVDFYALLNHSGEHSRLIRKVVSVEKEVIGKILAHQYHVDEIWIEYFLNFVAGGIAEVIHCWYMSGQNVSIDSLSTFFREIFMSNDVRTYIEAAEKHQ